MRVRVLLFGVLKEAAGRGEETLELPEGSTVRAVVDWTAQRVGSAGALRSIAVAVNREYTSSDRGLREGDEVALLPPVSGGCGLVLLHV